MNYCKWCGMESKDPQKCSWCGKQLISQQEDLSPNMKKGWEMVAEMEEDNKGMRVAFYISCITLLIIAAILVASHHELFFIVSISSYFVGGLLLGGLRILPNISEEWLGFVLPMVCLILFPLFVVYFIYLLYGLITREMNLAVVWLLSVYLVMTIVLQVIFFVAGPELVSHMVLVKLLVIDFWD